MQWTQAFSTIAIVLAAATTGSAGEFAILKEEIVAARSALVTMVLHREKRGPAEQKLVKDTADAVSTHLAKMKEPKGKSAEFKDLKQTWDAFKATREKELVPAILANDSEKFTKLGAGIQKERLDRIYALLAKLDK